MIERIQASTVYIMVIWADKSAVRWFRAYILRSRSQDQTSTQMERTIIKLPSEPVLDGVQEEDRPNVRNVIYLLYGLKLCISWSVTPKNQGYEVTGSVDCKANLDIERRDMECIHKVDPLRVTSVSVHILGGNSPTVSLVVFVLRKSEPVVLEEQEIVHVQRKRKFWFGGS
jgi:hypothetical protein